MKDDARKAGFARRKAAHQSGQDAVAQDAMKEALADFHGKPLAGYMPIRTEISPLPVMSDWAGAVGVPVILGEGRPLEFHRWTPDCKMVAGPFGAAVPATAQVMCPEVLIVPLVAFDDRGHRLGYGGGFYDRTLELLRANGSVTAIGFAYSAQKAVDLPLEPTDQPLDAIVTENGVIWFTR